MIKKNFTIDFILAPKLDHISASATTISTNINNNNNNSNRSNIKNSINNNTNDGITNITNTECNSDETVVQLNVEVDNYSIDGDGDGEGDSDFNGIGGLSQYSTSPSSATDRTQFRDPDKKTIPFCAKCKIHGQYFPVKNHKDQCKRRFCNCVNCKLIDKGKTLRGKKVKRG